MLFRNHDVVLRPFRSADRVTGILYGKMNCPFALEDSVTTIFSIRVNLIGVDDFELGGTICTPEEFALVFVRDG